MTGTCRKLEIKEVFILVLNGCPVSAFARWSVRGRMTHTDSHICVICTGSRAFSRGSVYGLFLTES